MESQINLHETPIVLPTIEPKKTDIAQHEKKIKGYAYTAITVSIITIIIAVAAIIISILLMRKVKPDLSRSIESYN